MGNEYQHDPSPFQLELAEQLLNDPNIDLIVGSHAHVVQPIGTINGKPVIYGLGNFYQINHSIAAQMLPKWSDRIRGN